MKAKKFLKRQLRFSELSFFVEAATLRQKEKNIWKKGALKMTEKFKRFITEAILGGMGIEKDIAKVGVELFEDAIGIDVMTKDGALRQTDFVMAEDGATLFEQDPDLLPTGDGLFIKIEI